MTRKPPPSADPAARRMRGFEAASSLLRDRIRAAGERRGFAVTRLLTHWADIVGDDIARTTRPVKVGYTREGLGATLTILAQGASAPMVEMQKDRIRSRVNACYGYNAISRVLLTQTSGAGVLGGLAAWLGFIGVADIHVIRVQPTYGSPEVVAAAMARAYAEAEALGRDLARPARV